RKMRAQPPPKVHGLADVDGVAVRILQGVDARRGRRGAGNPLADALPHVAPVFDDERLRHEPAREFGRRAADAEYFGRQLLMVRRVAHFRQAGEKYVSEHGFACSSFDKYILSETLVLRQA